MINLLPPDYKEILKQEEFFRLGLRVGILVVSFFLAFGIVLVAAKFFLENSFKSQELMIEKIEEELKTAEFNDLSQKMSFFQSNVGKLKEVSETPRFSEILRKLAELATFDMYFTQINISELSLSNTKKNEKPSEKYFQVRANGFISDRNSLLQFKEKLEKEEMFEDLYFPPLNWVKPTDIDFSFSFKIKE